MTGGISDPPDFDSFEWDDIPGAGEEVPWASESAEPPPPEAETPPLPTRSARRMSRRESDPIFIYIVLMALGVGLTPLASTNPIDRYTILWTLLAVAGVAGAILSDGPFLRETRGEDLLWGGALGVLVGAPLLLVGAQPLALASEQVFAGLPDGAVFQSLVFVMSTAESLFFRGMLQSVQSLLVTALMSSGWSVLLFFPTLDLGGYPAIALIVGTFIVMLSVLYSYVRQRNGLAAAWLCQIVVSVLWLFVPRLLV